MSASLQALPKVELHVHLDGSFDTALLFDTARKRLAANELPKSCAEPIAGCGDDVEAFRKLVTCLPEERSLAAMIDRFMLFLPIVQGQLELIEALAAKFVQQQAEQNVLYTEVRYSPHILTNAASFEFDESTIASANDDSAAKDVVDAVTRGLRRGCKEHPGTEIAQILCFIDGKPQWANELVDLAAEQLQATKAPLAEKPEEALPLCPVVAVDIAAGEAHFADSKGKNGLAHREAMCKCRKLGFGLTNHAGESGPAANVAEAARDEYGAATRVGHGYAAVFEGLSKAKAAKAAAATSTKAEKEEEEEVTPYELVAAMREMGIVDALTMECCPTSSKATGGVPEGPWTEHPIAVLSKLRLAAVASGDSASVKALPRATISSDDPSVFASTLTQEMAIAVDQMGLSLSDLKQAMVNAVEGSFLPPAALKRLRARLEAAWEALPEVS